MTESPDPAPLAPEAIAEAVARLVEARRQWQPLERLPPSCAPRSLADAYAIQEAFARDWGPRVAGYKIGCSSVEAQRLVGSPGPFPGRIFAPFCFASPADIAAADFFMIGVEAEFAFALRGALPPRGTPYRREEVADAVASVAPAIELCDTRLADWKAAGVAHIVADNGFNGGLVLGGAVAGWREFDLARHEVVLSVDGVERGRGTGALVQGHPLDSLVWLANDLCRRGFGLEADDVVATGTCTGLRFVAPGAAIEADFGAIGRVSVRVCG